MDKFKVVNIAVDTKEAIVNSKNEPVSERELLVKIFDKLVELEKVIK